MLRTILSVLAGYLAMFILVFIGFAAAYMLVKADGALKPGSFELTTLWVVMSIVLGFIVAVVAGFICATIARKQTGPMALAVVVLVLGLAFSIPVLVTSDSEGPAPRTGDVGMMEAMQNAKEPPWFVIVNPFMGAIGVLVGSRLRRMHVTGSPDK